jgi:hypothetical protein
MVGSVTEKFVDGSQTHLDNVVCYQPVGLSMDGFERLAVRPLGKTKHGRLAVIKPVRHVADAVLVLHGQIEFVRCGNLSRGRARRIMAIQKESHANSLVTQPTSCPSEVGWTAEPWVRQERSARRSIDEMHTNAALETDYLVVGAGALGMSFVDSVIENSDADVVMVERRHGPGGHWLDSYPFVQLHQPSRFYGVNSASLGQDRIEPGSTEIGFYERASGAEIRSYYDEVMRHRFLTSGQVRFFPMCDYQGHRRFRSRLTDEITDVTVRRSVVDATFMASRVPSTDPPPFDVAEGVRCVPVGELADLEHAVVGYVIVGGGKTALDAICWLLDRRIDPEDITWIRPRDTWVLNRAFFQPGQPRTFEGIVMQLEAMVAAESVHEVYERLEDDEVMLRTDPSVLPTMMKGATVSVGELDQLRQIDHVVRLGHVERITSDQIFLEQGVVPTTPEHIHVHCAAYGLSDNAPRPIFSDDLITLQLVTRLGLTLSGALQGFLESTARTTDEKNKLCLPTGWPHTPFDYLRAILAGISTEMAWGVAPDLQSWVDRSRLNIMAGLENSDDRDSVPELQGRFFTAVFPALDKLQLFASQATPRERARMYQPVHGGDD